MSKDFLSLVEKYKYKQRKDTDVASKPTATSSGGGSKTTSSGSTKDFMALVDTYRPDIAPTFADPASTVTVDIAPTKKTEKEEKWYNRWFQKGAFEDGYQYGDVLKTILGTTQDTIENVNEAVVDATENLIDTTAYGVGAVGGLFDKGFKDDVGDFIAKEILAPQKVGEWSAQWLSPIGWLNTLANEGKTEDNSILNDQADGIVQSGAHLVGSKLLERVGVPAWLTQGVNAFGSEIESAFQNDATFAEAGISGGIAALSEVVFEKLSSAIKFKGVAADESFQRWLKTGIKNKLARGILKFGTDVGGEGLEEVLTEITTALGKKATYFSEKEWNEILSREDLWDAFFGGALMGGVSNGVNAVKSAMTGRDVTSGLTADEEKVVNKIYEDLVAEAMKDGKVTSGEKTKIYERVTRELEKGGFSTDTIEELLDEEGYKAFTSERDNFFQSDTMKSYNDAVASEETRLKELQAELDKLTDAPNTVGNNKRYDAIVAEMTELQENPGSNSIKTQLDQEVKRINGLHNDLRTKVHEMVKGTKLEESYNELIRSNQKYEVDLNQYQNEHAKKTIENILKSGMGDNTNHFHEYADWLAKISADKGMSFSLTNDEALKGTEHDFSAEGLRVNGFKTDDGITLNMDSPKALNSTVGHEITHVLEQNTELYQTLQDTVFKYEIARNGQEAFDKRLKAIEERYKGKNADAKAELTADLIGDYLFTDYDFVHNLSVENRNLFQKIYDEIKYLCKVVTASSKEARELEKVKKVFEDNYRANVKGKPDTNTQHSLSNNPNTVKVESYSDYGASDSVFRSGWLDSNPKMLEAIVKNRDQTKSTQFTSWFGDSKATNTSEEPLLVFHGTNYRFAVFESDGKPIWFSPNVMYSRAGATKTNAVDKIAPSGKVFGGSNERVIPAYIKAENPADFGDTSLLFEDVISSISQNLGISETDLRNVWERTGRNAELYKTVHSAEMVEMLKQYGYDSITAIEDGSPTWAVFESNQIKSAVANKGTFDVSNPDIRYSLSDSTGRPLSKEQQDFFKDSKMRDENGNLKVMYHGSQDAGFHVFDGSMSDDGFSFFFTDRNDVAATYSGTSATYAPVNGEIIKKLTEKADSLKKNLDSKYGALIKDLTAYYSSNNYDTPELAAKAVFTNEQFAEISIRVGMPSELASRVREYFKIKTEERKARRDALMADNGVGSDANYEVYLNLTNPLVVDANGRDWNNLSGWSKSAYLKSQDVTVKRVGDEFRLYKGNQEVENASIAINQYNQNLDMDLLKSVMVDKANSVLSITTESMTKTREVAKWAKSNGYDGVIFKNILDNGAYAYGYEGSSTVAIAFDSNQIKSVANEKPTSDPDIRFSLSEAVEETKDLMALHNLHSSELLKQLKMGGMAYPSIAITKPEMFSHDGFGEVSVILHKDAIDPKKSKYNKIYSADAYTPTFPNVDYEASEQVAANITSKVNELYDKLPEYYQRSLRSLRDYTNIDDQLNRWGGEQRLFEKYADDYAMKQLYLAEKGEVVPVEKKSTETRMTDYQMKLYQTVADTIGEDVLKSFNDKGNFEKLGMARMAWLEKHGEKLKNIFAEDWSSEGTMTKEEALEIANEQKPIYWKGEIDRALDFIKTGGVTVTETDDIGTTQAKIDEKIAGSDYKQWVENLFSGIEGQSGIRNSKDIFTPSGNRRSFAQTHDPLTVDNIVKAMRKENQTGQGAFGGGSILGASAKEFGSIAEVKRNAGKLGMMDKAEHDAITDKINDTFWDIAKRYANGKDIIDAQEAIAEAVSKNESKAGIARYLQQYDYVYKYTDSIGDEIIELRDYIRSLPTPYFEAKPRRGVGFDEVAAFVIPDNADIKLKQELLNRGYNIAEYDPNVEGDRQRVVNQFEEFKFSLSNVGDNSKQYGDWNVYGSDFGAKDDSFAPVIPTPNRNVLPGERQSVGETFPDEPDVDQYEYENVVAAKEATEGLLEELESYGLESPEAVAEYDRVFAEWTEAATRALELESGLSEQFDSLSDADAPPEMDAPYYESDPTTLTKKATADIVRDVRANLGLNNTQMADCKDIIEQYRSGEIQTREQLVDALQDSFGTYTETETDEYLQEVKNDLRTRPILVPKHVQRGIADYAQVMRSMRGRLRFSKNGSTPDVLYKELNELYPTYYPLDMSDKDSKISPEDALRKMMDIATTPHIKETQRPKDIENIEEAADLIINGISNFRQNQNLTLSNRESKQAFDSLVRQGDKYAPMGDIAPVAPVAEKTQTSVKPVVDAPVKPTANTSGKVAEVLTKASKKSKQSGVFSKAVAATVDKGSVFETLSLNTGNMEVQSKWQYALPSQTEARAQYFMENGENGVKSLKSVMKEVNKSKKTDLFQNYLYHVHNVDRMTLEDRFGVPNKAVYGDSVTADISRKKATRLLKQNPEFKRWAQDIYNINKQVRSKLVEGGLISQEVADLWEQMYPHYVPITRVDQNGANVNVPLDSNKTGVNAPVKRATGGSSNIEPLFNTMAQRIQQTYRAIARNSFGVELKNTLGTELESKPGAGVDEMIDTIEMQEELLKQGGFGLNPTFTVFENGDRVEFEITEDMYDALKPANKILASRNSVITGASNFRRNLLTVWNPVFALYRNPIKDIQDVAVNSQHPLRTYANVPNAIIQMLTNGEMANEYHQNGGKSNTYFDSRKNEFKADDNIFKKVIGMPVRAIETAGEFIEEIPRLAEYIASRKDGRSVERSMLDAARVTTNFAAGGDFTKFLNAHGFTFLNASVQGAAQHVRNFREATKLDGFKGFTKTLTKYVIAGVPAMILNGLLWDDDEEYEELSDYVKQNYFVVAKTDEGKFIRIPKGRTTAVMHEVLEQMQNLVTGDDEADFSTFFELFLNNIAPNNPLKNNIISPIAQAVSNNAWYEGDIVPTRLQDLPAEEQFDESTDAISKWLGEKTGWSPMKINYLLDQYSGGLGDTFLPMLTPEAESGDDSLVGNLLAPWKKEMTTDMVLNNKNPGDFYDLKDELEVISNGKNATEEDKMRALYMDTVSWEMGDLYAQKREIQSGSLPDSVKYEKVRELQEQINELAKNATSNYENVSIDGLYSEVGDKRFNLDADSGNWYEIKPTKADGSDNWYYQKEQEVTKALGISYGEYWNNREEYNFAYDKPDQYAFSKVVGGYDSYMGYRDVLENWQSDSYIRADKDENGKSISGSRKEKIIDYLNNLDTDYGEKIILFKSQYPSDDTYNQDIFDYINGRDDLSYDEKVSIFKYLEFDVDSDGYVRW